jgi:hypothetical protein
MASLGRIVAGLGFVVLVGCGPDVTGSWDFEDNGDGFSDTMALEEGGSGEREIKGYIPAACGDFGGDARVTLTFDLEWELDGDTIELKLECKDASARLDGCEPLDGCDALSEVFGFDLEYDGECELNEEGDEMDCEFDGLDDTVTFEKS